MKRLFFLVLVLHSLIIFSQTSVYTTPVKGLGLRKVKVEIPPQFASKVDTSKFYINLPPGYYARLFYAGGLIKPRFLSFDEKGVLYVSDMGSNLAGKIYALPDKNNDGIADTAIVAASGFTYNHDVKFYKGAMYVTESNRVNKLQDLDNDGVFETKSVFISNIPSGSGHVTRTIVFDSLNHKAYLSIGSSCNVCRDTDRAIIEQYNDDGTGRRTFASGARNAVGMTLHPVTNKLWADNNGSDRMGDTIPPEWTDIVRDGGFYGWPFAYGDGIFFNFDAQAEYKALKPITSIDSGRVAKMIPPAALVHAHYAPMALQFLNPSFPSVYRHGFIEALRGSWNTSVYFVGYKLVYMDLSDDQDTTVNTVSDFCTGFLSDSLTDKYWARPVGVAADHQGRIFMTSDETNRFVLMIYPDTKNGIIEEKDIEQTEIYPNPFQDYVTISYRVIRCSNLVLSVYDISGKLVESIDLEASHTGLNKYELDTKDYLPGIYYYKLQSPTTVITGRMACIR
jgi:glucose/arabinose dehydrogenase